MDNFLTISNDLKSYSEFNKDVINHKNVLMEFKSRLDLISPFKMNISKVINVFSTIFLYVSIDS